MSSTNRGAVRNPEDFYRTPWWCVDRLLDEVAFSDEESVIEPCAGRGDIVLAAKQCYPDWMWGLVEKREEEQEALDAILGEADVLAIGDAFEEIDASIDFATLILTNPPFVLAQRFIQTFAPLVPRSFWLLRLNFLGSKKRRNWLAREQPNVYILPDRPCFGPTLDKETGDWKRHPKTGKLKLSTDSIEYAWFEFGAHTTGKWTLLDLTPKEEIKDDLLRRFPEAA